MRGLLALSIAGAAGTLVTGCHVIAGYDKLTLRDQAEVEWSRSIGDKSFADVTAVGSDGGRTLIAGTFGGSLVLGQKTLIAAADRDGFVAVLDAEGNYTDTFALGADQFVRPLAASARPFIAGYFGGKLRAGSVSLTAAAGQTELFLLELDSTSGGLARGFQFGGTGFSSYHDTLDLAVDSERNIALGGGYAGQLDFNDADCPRYESQSQLSNIFFAKLTQGGDCLWSFHNDDTAPQAIESIASDDITKYLVIGGEFAGKLDFGMGAIHEASGGLDFFIARFDPAGNHQWSKSFGNGGIQSSARVAAAPLGSSALAGYFEGDIDFGAGPDKKLSSSGGHDLFVVKFEPNGKFSWNKQFSIERKPCDPMTCDLDKIDIAFDADRNLVVAGAFRGRIELDDGVVLSSDASSVDYFLAKFDPDGNLLWSGRFGDGKDQCREPDCRVSLGIDNGRNVLFAGYFEGAVDFGNGERGKGPLVSTGARDGFIAKFLP